ncbi:MAG: hypothetical protein AAF337_10280 [Pseudomonadota bacterium]
MMRAFVLALGLIVTVPANAAGPMTVKDAIALKNAAQTGDFSSRAQWTALSYYLQGVIEGAVSTARVSGPAGGFCPAENARYDLGEIFMAFEKLPSKQAEQMAAMAVAEHLRALYPCKS